MMLLSWLSPAHFWVIAGICVASWLIADVMAGLAEELVVIIYNRFYDEMKKPVWFVLIAQGFAGVVKYWLLPLCMIVVFHDWIIAHPVWPALLALYLLCGLPITIKSRVTASWVKNFWIGLPATLPNWPKTWLAVTMSEKC